MLRLVHSHAEAPVVSPEDHIKQRERVRLAERLSTSRAERQQEAATVSRIYSDTLRHRNVIALPQRIRKPEPPDAA